MDELEALLLPVILHGRVDTAEAEETLLGEEGLLGTHGRQRIVGTPRMIGGATKNIVLTMTQGETGKAIMIADMKVAGLGIGRRVTMEAIPLFHEAGFSLSPALRNPVGQVDTGIWETVEMTLERSLCLSGPLRM